MANEPESKVESVKKHLSNPFLWIAILSIMFSVLSTYNQVENNSKEIVDIKTELTTKIENVEKELNNEIIIVEDRLNKKIKIINEHTEAINELIISDEMNKKDVELLRKDIEIASLKLELKIERALKD